MFFKHKIKSFPKGPDNIVSVYKIMQIAWQFGNYVTHNQTY